MLCTPVLLAFVIILISSCQKEISKTTTRENLADEKTALSAGQADLTNPPYDLNVTLRGAWNSLQSEDVCPVGHLKFRQDPDPEKIIDLDIKIHNMLPNHEYFISKGC